MQKLPMRNNKVRRSKVSFMSEHTAEYILVPNLINSLNPFFSNIFPFYFWQRREGNAMSRWCGEGKFVRIVIVFPRRPKINLPEQNELLVKFNYCLFDVAHIAKQIDIPVFAGVPLVSSLFKLNSNIDCAWFHFNTSDSQSDDVQVTLPLNCSQNQNAHGESCIDGPLNIKTLVDYINSGSKTRSWDDALDEINSLKYLTPTGGFFGGFGGYKPFYLAIIDDH